MPPTVRAAFTTPVCRHMYSVTPGRDKSGPYGGRRKRGPYGHSLSLNAGIA